MTVKNNAQIRSYNFKVGSTIITCNYTVVLKSSFTQASSYRFDCGALLNCLLSVFSVQTYMYTCSYTLYFCTAVN